MKPTGSIARALDTFLRTLGQKRPSTLARLMDAIPDRNLAEAPYGQVNRGGYSQRDK
jgi:hypothetical protein